MNQLYPLQLLQTKGIGDAFLRRFFEYVTHYGESAAERIVHSVSELCAIFNIKELLANEIVHSGDKTRSLAAKLADAGIHWTTLVDKEYPTKIRNILGKESPPLIFYKGNIKLCEESTVGFCGSRSASEKGLAVTERCCKQLVEHKITIVSGYAHGVDMTSHKTALQENGNTIIVLAEGMFHFQEKHEIQNYITSENHLVISQFPPDLPWLGRSAMKRNSTIIALSDAMLLVESGLKGGTYAAGIECLRTRVPLFVIDFAYPPGPSAMANPEFISKGGIPIRGTREGVPNLKHVFDAIATNNPLNGRVRM